MTEKSPTCRVPIDLDQGRLLVFATLVDAQSRPGPQVVMIGVRTKSFKHKAVARSETWASASDLAQPLLEYNLP
jgi:hypothetical protein